MVLAKTGVVLSLLVGFTSLANARGDLVKYDDFQNEPTSHNSLWTNMITGTQPQIAVDGAGGNQYIILDNTAVGTSGTKAVSLALGAGETVYDLSQRQIHLTYDYYYDDNATYSYFAGLSIGSGSGRMTIRTRGDNSSSGGRILVDGQSGATGATWGGSTKVAGDKWFHVDVTIDTATGQVTLYTWDRAAAGAPSEPDGYTVGSAGYLYAINTTISNVDWAHSTIYWYNENGRFDAPGAANQNRGRYLLDNIYTNLVPEPATMLIVGLGSLALLRRKP